MKRYPTKLTLQSNTERKHYFRGDLFIFDSYFGTGYDFLYVSNQSLNLKTGNQTFVEQVRRGFDYKTFEDAWSAAEALGISMREEIPEGVA